MSEPFVEVVDEATLQERVAQLGSEISADYEGTPPIVVGVLKGSLPFMTDLVKHLPFGVELDFLSLTRFGHHGRVSLAMDTSLSMDGRDVLIVEDIVDTGLTLTTLRRLMEVKGARDVRTVALLDKATRRIVDVPVEYRGFEVGDEFLLGYGLDWEGRFRNVRSLWGVMDLKTLADEPQLFAQKVFGEGALIRGVAAAR